ncbi:putative calpain-like cysteine peptidase putativecysteine peptidase Clan CA family C2 [Leptomonas pyrrhocoris]|uniref:Putative calpain-like cysteine peptidase putativecysteine peptidase Clan CA family C2 n=1 Tax=Leptomonas pyrrhocoris TaxID=157538 RepID=A0A0N0DQT6_LEPPY|nr:putative calpain-like cysteine peptidase putativecysteine peptidase Clan CA family C2 [Leptomonas pyrrhocoris]KPA73484.1 putative calpain-like cysteine peptidase putativecysteine peptidase Clan CA family C2 [Leptomonas pyrrhocoris]|eukprot:XP_015651923.1 putative calpain-like cysteine peptidase putativecysteine peptidase Clan CA family C2 [Leptomonas pyrrhocoris]
MTASFAEVPDSHTLFKDTEFINNNREVSDQWVSIRDLYPRGAEEPLLPEKLSRGQFAQGNHYECFMLSALAALVRFPDVVRNCFVTKQVREDGRYTFQFFRGQQWVKVEIDDSIALEDDDVLYMQSPTEHWWPLLLEKAYAKFYNSYGQLDGCTLLETFHDLTGSPVLNIPMTAKLAKSAGVDIADGQYWLSLGESLQRGDFVASTLTKASDLEAVGMQSEQQYAILEIFSLTGSSTLDDIVVHLHNPFEDAEFEYNGPLNKNDSKWTAKQRKQYPVDDRHSIFIPLNNFLQLANSIQFCFMRTIEDEAQYFNSAWEGESAGGNPTFVTWRKNPAFLVRNDGATPVKIVVVIKQEDQRRTAHIEEGSSYRQCGLVVVKPSYPNPAPTLWITGNNHRPIYKSLFLNSREVANVVTIPPNSMCFMLPSTLQPSLEASFRLAVYRFKNENYTNFSVEKLQVPGLNWADPAKADFELREKEKERVDFYVDEASDVHVLLHQQKPFVSKSGGDAMTEDYMGMYLYDDTDRKIGGVHAATNFREISIIHHLPRSGRYALSLTCPRAKGDVPAYVTIVATPASHVRIVDPPEDATMFDDEDLIDEGDEADQERNPIDYVPFIFDTARHTEPADSASPFEDKRFFTDNRGVTTEPWVHIGDLYPEGKTKPLLPDVLNHGQFEQGEHYNCSGMTALAGLLGNNADVIRNCFISKKPRKDGRYTFQFHRYGQWVKVEIDDRIPVIKGDTLFCRSPTHHWWPLLLEKAYAKFYTLYDNLEHITQEEVFHDFTGQPCLTVSTNPRDAKVNMSYFDEAEYWLNLATTLPNLCMTAQASGDDAEAAGLVDEQYYAILDIIPLFGGNKVSDILVKMFNPFEDSPYYGPMNPEDDAWTSELVNKLHPGEAKRNFFVPANHFTKVFSSVQMGYVRSLDDPSWHFNSEWSQGTNGGNATLISWRDNPLYVFRNESEDPVQVVAMLRQPDQRHLMHTLDNQELKYPRKGLTVALANPNSQDIPTHLVTLDNHRLVHSLPLLPQREVTNVLTFPPRSLCYVVGHLDGQENSKFLLSYWFEHTGDKEKLEVVRYQPTVAKHAPALAHVDLQNRGKERVDFLVDSPTDVHAVVRQEKLSPSPTGGDIIAEDYLGVYLYDLQNRRIKGSQSAMNYRELSVVTHLDKPGHYVIFCTCPRGYGEVPCKVEICAVEEAHVRITDPPDDTKELDELDMAFLEQCPEGIPLAELNLNVDRKFQQDLTTLRRLLDDPSASDAEIQRLKNRLNSRARELAKAKLGQERPTYLPDRDLEALNPFLDESKEYMAVEKERYELKKDPRNDYKIPALEEKLRALADVVADEAAAANVDFIDARVDGISRDDLQLMSHEAFAELMKQRARLLLHADEHPQEVADNEAALAQRAREIAHMMHQVERGFLDPTPEDVPLEFLPLNSDEEFCEMEDELRALLRTPPVDPLAVRKLQAQLNERAHELARELKNAEREKFMGSEFAVLDAGVLDSDEDFKAKETMRLRLLHDDPEGNAKAIRSLEESLNTRAAELAEAQKTNERAFLAAYGVDADVLRDVLGSDPRFTEMEERLRELRKNPLQNAAAIKALEKEMANLALEMDTQYRDGERAKTLQDEYEGHPSAALPLNDDAAFCEAEAAYLKARASGVATPEELQRLLDAMNERAAAVAHEMNADDRSKYLPKAVRGLPVKALPLDDDDEFCGLEAARARAMADPRKAAEVAALEEQLRARADELARARLASDRAYLHPKPAGVPLSLVPIDSDEEFCSKEGERARLKASAAPNSAALVNIEADLNQRAAEVAQQLKESQRAEVLEPSYEDISIIELPLDADDVFGQYEVERLRLKNEDPHANAQEMERLKNAMIERASELAASKKSKERGFLGAGASETHISAEKLQHLLDKDSRFAVMEKRLRELHKKPKENAASIKAQENEMRQLAQSIEEEYLAEARQGYLKAEYEGRPWARLPLNDDAAFREAEAAYLEARDAGTASPSELQRLLDAMNERAAAVAHEMNADDRSKYLPKAVRGLPVKALPLDDDDEFCGLEAERARAMADPRKAAEVAALEEQLRARADELARARLASDRAFLDTHPEGVPLDCLHIDDHEHFRVKEEQRAAMLASGNAAANRGAIVALEESMNQQVHDMAKKLKQTEIAECVPSKLRGIPRELLPLMEDEAATQIMVARATSQAATDSATQAGALKARAKALAAAAIDGVRSRMAQAELQIPLADLPLDEDEAFKALEVEAIQELRKPKPDSQVMQDLVVDLDKRAYELAEQQCCKERAAFLQPNPEGRPLTSLPLDADRAFMAAETRHRTAAKDPNADAALLRSLEDKMNERVLALAREANRKDRSSYLPPAMRGVAQNALPLDDDDEFRALEIRRAAALHDPKQKATVKETEDALRNRALAMAENYLRNDRNFLDPRPEGVPLRQVPVDADRIFSQLEEQRAQLRTSASAADSATVKDTEEQMNARAHELATEAKNRLRSKLEQDVLGIPLTDLPLDSDATFNQLEERLRDAEAQQDGNATASVKAELNQRALELAEHMHKEERGVLEQTPEGVPLRSLPINIDLEFLALEGAVRGIVSSLAAAGQRPRNSDTAKLAALQDQLNQRACAMVYEERKAYCDAEPEGLPLETLGLAREDAFLKKEAERRKLLASNGPAGEGMQACNRALNDMAHSIARRRLEGDRGYLDAEPEGVALEVLPLSADPKFHALEVERARLKAQNSAAAASKVKALEDKLNERAHELALAQKEEDLNGLEAAPFGVPLSVLQPHTDPTFAAMADELRKLKKKPADNKSAIEALEAQMNEQCRALAKSRVEDDRDYLAENPNGVPLSLLPLDTDAAFQQLQARRANLKSLDPHSNASAIQELEGKLNDRASELANERIAKELEGVDRTPFGVPLGVLQPYEDPEFKELVSQLRQLPTLDGRDPQVARLKAAMNERCQTMAHALLENDRGYLHKYPKEVPLSLLALSSDPTFHAAEVRRAVLKADNPRRNAEKITEMENQLNLRAMELAERRRAADLEGLDIAPEGLPLAVVDPHSDAQFAQLVEQRRALELKAKDPAAAKEQLPALIREMNDRAHELARGMLQGDRDYLDRNPEGVPLEELPLDTDESFRAMEVERKALKAQKAAHNASKIKELEGKLNDRAHELAKMQKAADLEGINSAPRGVPLELLKPHEDAVFAKQVQKLRDLKRNPPRDVNETKSHVADMNARADELAQKVMDRAYLDPAPDKVPLEFLPLDKDKKFHTMEVERAKLKLTDPRRQADKISALEAELNERALELAKQQRTKDVEAVDSKPCGIPKDLLNLHEDAAACALIDELRELNHSPTQNANAIAAKSKALNARAHELAERMLTGDRASYLEARPRGIPLEDLPLNTDPAFRALEVERATLKASNPVRNADAVSNTEGLLNDRACELAEVVKDEDLAAFPPHYEGILVKDLKPHNDRLFGEAAEKRRSRKRNPSVSFKEDLDQLMSDRLSELAREAKGGDLYFLDPNPNGVPLADLALSSDSAFAEMREQRRKLSESDPMGNRKAICQLEDNMNARVSKLALDVLKSDFDGIDPKPLGIALELLNPRQDKTVASMIPELRRTKRLPQLKNKAVELKGKLNERVLELAGTALEQGRDDYLDPEPNGVPLALLPLRTDEQFHDKEAERATLRLKDVAKNASAIGQLEAQLNQRVRELAEAQQQSDLEGVDPTPRGIPIMLLEPHDDVRMAGLIKDVRVLKKDSVRNAAKITAQQRLMNDRALELATAALDGDRGYLDPNPGGVPLYVLPLDTDPAFHDMEVARAVGKRSAYPDPRAMAQLEDKLKTRSEELAAAQLKRDVEGLDQAPLGVPLTLLKPHKDSTIEAMLPELRRLAKDPSANAAKLKQLRAAANERNYELAEAFLAKDRPTYIEAAPEGLPLHLLPLSSDEEFKQLEAKKLFLQAAEAEGAGLDARDLAKLEEQLRERAHEVARQQLRKDRGYLDPFPEGVPLDVLPLETDRTFHQLEAKRAEAKALNANTAASDLEDQLNARAHELAVAQKQEDLRGLEQNPCGIPLTALEPHQDARYAQLVDDLRGLKASAGDGSGSSNRAAIAAVQQQMNDRAREMAEMVTKNDRRYLHPRPENVPLHRVPLDTDAAFHALEVERATLKLADPKKNQHRIGELEDQLNNRSHALASQVKATDYQGLLQAPRGIPIQLLNLHNDPKFSSLLEEKEHVAKTRSAEAVAPVVQSLNACAEEAAEKLLQGDRGYLDREPEGVPLSQLPLDKDSTFNEFEVQRAVLKAKDPEQNASTISDIEDQLNARAHELASVILARDRQSYLDPQPEGVLLAELPLDTDSKFHVMEIERAKLKARDPVVNAARIEELEGSLNVRAVDLARKQLEEDLQGLDREPEGYPLKYLRPHHDAAFAAAVPSLRAAKRKAAANPAKVREVQATLNARAHAMARERIAADRAKMDPEPQGVPLALLPLEEDAKFRQAEKEMRAQEAAADKRNAAAAEEAIARMNERARVLAKDYLRQSRDFLDQEPEGIPLSDVPLGHDATFRNMEGARLRLLAGGASPSSSEVQAICDRLNERAHELAKEEKAKGRSFLRDTSSDIPRELLALDDDRAFVAKEKELRSVLRSNGGVAGPTSAPALCRELQIRADEVGEAQLKGGRGKYLDAQPAGVDLCDIPLEEDAVFHTTEVKRAVLLATNPQDKKDEVAALEEKLNARANELGRQIAVSGRSFLPPEIYGIPIDELPLDTDSKFKKLERQRRAHKRTPTMKKEVLADEEELRVRANELANEVIGQDLETLKATYRGIPKEELGLHADEEFRELAKKRRRCRGKGRVEATQMAAIEDDMDRRACEIADDVIENERAFLDAEPEGMFLGDVPLDSDTVFQQLELEYRRRSKDPRTTKLNKEVLRELGEEMNRRSHTLAREEFARRREFMKQEPEGIPLWELGLDEDPEFKQAEITRYRNTRTATPDENVRAETAKRMDERAGELARTLLAADRAFLDPEPEGVALELLPLDSDKAFSDLARERRRHKKALKSGAGEPEVRAVEERMNTRTHEMAKDFLEAERAFLTREPEGVPLEDLPLNSDAPFRAMEKERLRLKREPVVNASPISAKEAELENRAEVIARELLRKERAFLEPEPMGVPLEELPLNRDPILNQVERKRRALRENPKRNHEGIRACEEQMADRIGEIATAFVEKQRSFLDQVPEGVPLRYLPLGSDRDFHEKELLLRKMLQRPEKNKAELAELQKKMNDRVHAMAKELVLKGRAFLNPEPLGVPIADVPLNGDEDFRKMEEQRRALKEAGRNPAHIKSIEDKLNERAEMLAQKLLDTERAFMDPAPLGIPLRDLPLNNDARLRTIERTRRQLRKEDAERNAADISVLECGMDGRAYELADELLANDRDYLHPEPCGVPLRDLPLHADQDFHHMELEHFRGKKKGKVNLAPLEGKLNERLMELAANFIKKDRAFLDQEPEGIPLERLPLDTDPVFHSLELDRRQLRRGDDNAKSVREIEQRMNSRIHELALEIRGWQDNEFHEANRHVAEAWPRVCELYPESRGESIEVTTYDPSDVVSAPQDAGYIAPFLSAMARHSVLIKRLIATKEPPVNAPYTFVFFDPNSNPVYVDIDDRIPCTANRAPKFVQSPSHSWYPLLVEKAYAKFVGGYEQLDNCTPLETLRDLTGRPVTHTPFDVKLAEAANLGDSGSVEFWQGVSDDLGRGDVIVCTSSDTAPDGIHPRCSYALLGVIVTLAGSTNPSDVVIKLENSYCCDEPYYSGPLCHGDINWNVELQQVCRYDPERTDVLYLPLPTFLRNFSSIQTCHINCGDRLTAGGCWDSRTSGGNPKYTSFRNNPIYLLQNSSSRPATVLVELRHDAPQFIDPDGLHHYPQSGIVLMEPTLTASPPTPLVTNSTAKFLQKGIMLDSREMCSIMEVPPSTTCWLIPYTAKAGQHGSFHLSVYPGFAKVSLTPMHFCGLSRTPTNATVTLSPGEEGRRVDFTVSAACEVHVLLHQEKVSDSHPTGKGDVVADDDVVMVAFNDQAMKITSSGDATNAREHSLAFRADKPGYYSLLLTSPNPPVSGDCPCTISIFTPKRVTVKFVAPPVGARPLQQSRFPTLSKNGKKQGIPARRLQAPSSSRSPRRGESLPPLRNACSSPGEPAAASRSTPASLQRQLVVK